MYAFIRFLHVAIAIFGMGPHFVASVLLRAIRRRPESYPALNPVMMKVVNFPKHSAPLMLITGLLLIWLNGAGWALLAAPWMIISLVLFLFCAIFGRVREGAPARELAAMEGRGKVDPVTVEWAMGHFDATLTIMGVALVAIVMLMVFKPF